MTLTDGIDFPGGKKKEITPRRDRERCETGEEEEELFQNLLDWKF